ncbi:MAG: hypothetical protein HC836_29230 [Richelia sp. RM2_1_2]|nr:hypothetical protein [Richelia sp. RM1_1_1]NJO62166.1 hypothetical protein [Richelia sp. RM2_1_2]
MKFNRVWLVCLVAVLLLISFIPVRIAVTFRQAPTPQAIFVLGGDFARTKFAGKFWLSRRDLDIWVSASILDI